MSHANGNDQAQDGSGRPPAEEALDPGASCGQSEEELWAGFGAYDPPIEAAPADGPAGQVRGLNGKEKEPYPDGTVLVDVAVGSHREPCPICGLILISKHVHQLPVKDSGKWFFVVGNQEPEK